MLILFGSEKYEAIYNRIRYLTSLKSSITCIFSHYFAIMNYRKRLTLHNFIVHIKSVLNKDKNHYYKIFYKIIKFFS